MSRAVVRFPADELTAQIRAVQGRLASDRRDLLTQLGVELLSLSQLAYREMARGGTGSDGITWKRLERTTIEQRVRSRAPAKRIVAQRRELARQIQRISGPGSSARKRPLIQRRRELARQLRAMVDREFANHEIGVDTGLQRASAGPGFQANDGQGGNIFDVTAGSVTVGYGREYSQRFDRDRQLMPAMLPAAWQQKLEGVAAKWGDDILRQTLGAR